MRPAAFHRADANVWPRREPSLPASSAAHTLLTPSTRSSRAPRQGPRGEQRGGQTDRHRGEQRQRKADTETDRTCRERQTKAERDRHRQTERHRQTDRRGGEGAPRGATRRRGTSRRIRSHVTRTFTSTHRPEGSGPGSGELARAVLWAEPDTSAGSAWPTRGSGAQGKEEASLAWPCGPFVHPTPPAAQAPFQSTAFTRQGPSPAAGQARLQGRGRRLGC